ncbi:MAG: hypothetical protein J5802_10765 [Butyrivibrio sp.]|nr:hypothetical protein [Butyrivibrio sp.]
MRKRRKNRTGILLLVPFAVLGVVLLGCGSIDKVMDQSKDLYSEGKELYGEGKEIYKKVSSVVDSDGDGEGKSLKDIDVSDLNIPSVKKNAEEPGIIKDTADLNFHDVDGGRTNYAFTYDGREFTAKYTTDNWKVIDSYLIQNEADITAICSVLIEEHPVHGKDMVSYRTAGDMAYEWVQHNLAYAVLPDDSRWKKSTKDVDLNPADQGLSFVEIYERQTGKELTVEEIMKHIG